MKISIITACYNSEKTIEDTNGASDVLYVIVNVTFVISTRYKLKKKLNLFYFK